MTAVIVHSYPYAIISTSAAAYTALLYSVSNTSSKQGTAQLRKTIKIISACHSAGTTILALYALNYLPWSIEPLAQPLSPSKSPLNPNTLDDERNPIIAGTCVFANKLTSWETGYLIYDTGALLFSSYLNSSENSLRGAVKGLWKDSPIFFAHHLALISALFYLQTYISAGRERGIQVILAFLLMNASNPLLHLRWALKKRYGAVSGRFDAVFAAVFAVSRFGVVSWVMRRYGLYHDMSAWRAFYTLRPQCQAGVATLVGVNAIWWIGLLRKLLKDSLA